MNKEAVFSAFSRERPSLIEAANSLVARWGLRVSGEDLASEALLRTIRSKSPIQSSDPLAFRAYMVRAMRNLSRELARRGSRWDSLVEGESGPSATERPSTVALEIDQLAPRDAAVVALRNVAGLSHGDVACALGLASSDAARIRHSRALAKLSGAARVG